MIHSPYICLSLSILFRMCDVHVGLLIRSLSVCRYVAVLAAATTYRSMKEKTNNTLNYSRRVKSSISRKLYTHKEREIVCFFFSQHEIGE